MYRRCFLFILLAVCLTLQHRAATAIEYRYWFDDDTAAVRTVHGQAQSWQTMVDVSGLEEAIHTIHLQALDKDGVASSPVTRHFVRTMLAGKPRQVTYWVDDSATPLLTSSVTQGMVELDVNSLPDGFHYLHVQALGERLSSAKTFAFLKMRNMTNIGALNCLCWIDGELYGQARLAAHGGIVSWELDVNRLSQGLHLVQLQVLADDGVASRTVQSFFYRVPTRAEMGEVRCYYSIDDTDNRQLAGQLADGMYHFDIDVSSIDDGPHRLTCMLSDGSSANSRIVSRYFIKQPVGGYGVARYDYWLNDSSNQAVSVTLPQQVSPYRLISLLPFDHWPLRSCNFEFGVEQGQPVICARNDLHVRFYDGAGRFIDMTRTFVDPVVKQDVNDITLVLPGETKTANRPGKDEIVWYKVDAHRGDSLIFKSDRACTVQVFSPSGQELSNVSGSKSVKWEGAHATEDGTYYVAQHDVTATQGTTLDISYQRIDKYAILRYTPSTVGVSPSIVSFNLDGNGYDRLTSAKLVLGDRVVDVDSIDIKSKSEASLLVSVDESFALGQYSIVLNFEDDDGQSTLVKDNAVRFVQANFGKVKAEITVTNYARRPLLTVTVRNTGNTAQLLVPLNIAFDAIEGINTAEFEDFYIYVDSASHQDGYRPFVQTSNFLGNGKSGVVLYTVIPLLNPNETQEYRIAFTAPIDYCFNFYAWTGNAANTIEAWEETETNIPSLPHYCQELGFEDLRSSIDRAPSIADIIDFCRSAYQQYNRASDVANTYAGVGHAIGNTIIGMQHTIDDAWIESSGGLLTSEDFGRNYRPLPPPSSFVHGPIGHALRLWEQQQRCSNDPTPAPGQQPVRVHAPYDPNEIWGYVAESGSHAIGASVEQVGYTIEFENDPEFASASAHTIVVTDTIDGSKHDLATFAPTSVKLGDVTMSLDGEQSFVKTMDLRPAIDVIAQVELNYDRSNGIARWLMTSLDPMTMEETDDFMQGILPVNSGGNGIGEVTYDIALRPNLAQGTVIRNRAAIKFDSEAVIMTPDWVNVIDGVAPESHVNGCELVNDSTAAVSIQGMDDRSGPWRYDAYVQYGESSDWFLAASHVSADSAALVRVYEGINHGFYAVLTDSAGNVEQKLPVREYSLDYFSPTVDSQLTLSLASGWNWMSHNLNVPLSVTSLQPGAYRIVGQEGETIRDPRFGYTGTIDELDPTRLYKVQMSQSASVQLDGKLYNSAFKSTDLIAGWNWLGYPLAGALPPGEALIRLEAQEGDCIIGQEGMAMFSEGLWSGTLTSMTPGQGYMLKVQNDATLRWNSPRAGIRQNAPHERANEAPYSVDAYAYPNVMGMVADLYENGSPVDADQYWLVAWCNDECRGVARPVNGHLMMNVHGNGGETIVFKAVDSHTGHMQDVTEVRVFTSDVEGTLQQPVPLHIGTSAVHDVSLTGLRVYPTVTEDVVSVALADGSFDKIEVINARGLVIMSYNDMESHATINLGEYPDGVYLIRVTTSGGVSTTKVVKQK